MSDTDLLLGLTRTLLDAITSSNWEKYESLCDSTLSCFEPEALGNLVEGMEFHRFYFANPACETTRVQTTMASPHVRMLGNVGIVSYLRLTQVQHDGQPPCSQTFEETRVWHKQEGNWKHVHFHRSLPAQ